MKTNFLIKNALPRGSGVFLKMVVMITALLCSHLMAYAQPTQVFPPDGGGAPIPVILEWSTTSTSSTDIELYQNGVVIYSFTVSSNINMYEFEVTPTGGGFIDIIGVTYSWRIKSSDEDIWSEEWFFTTEDDCSLKYETECDDGNPCTVNDIEELSMYPHTGGGREICTPCAGTPLPDTDSDYICDIDDVCPDDATNNCIGDYCGITAYRSAERSYPVAIESVVLNGEANLSGYDNGYGDYTGTVLARVGNMNSISVTPNDANMRYGVWIDFNKDGDFDDVGDEVFSSINSLTEFSFEFSAPPGVGTTTMRVVVTGDSYPFPCGTLYAAEVEDYTVALSADCPPYLTVYDFDVPGDYNAFDFTQTDDAPDAAVTVNTGEHLELSGGNRVRLNNGFSVASGGTLRADNEDCQ